MLYSDTVPMSFPGLGIGEFNPPDGFCIPGTAFVIKFYGVIIALGVLLAVVYALRRCRQFGLTSDDIFNVVLVGIPCAVVGARAYYVIFEWDRFFGEGIPWYQCLMIRDGGLAIYGGIIGATIGLVIFFLTGKNRRAKLLPSFDIAGLGLLIGQSLGRWGNFFNREAHGGVTDSILRMGFKLGGEWVYYHPTFLYESVWNLAGLVLLHFLSKKRKFDGQVFLYYIMWYGLGRVWIEGLRTDSLYLGGFRISQLLAGASCLLAAGVLIFVLLIKRPDPAKMLVNRGVPGETSAQEDTTKE